MTATVEMPATAWGGCAKVVEAATRDVWKNNLPNRSNVFEELRMLFRATNGRETIDPDSIQDAARHFADIFGVPALAACGAGPQSQRVDALDKVASSISLLPKSPMSGAILGLAASLIDPGSAVMPSLLKQYYREYPLAQLWAGAFAGAWSPARVLNDHKGLGRIISKELLAPSDLFSKPFADIGFDEFQRWRGESPSSAVGVRGSLSQMTTVELLPGVSIPIAHSRSEPARESRSGVPVGRQQAFDLDIEARRPIRSSQSSEARFDDVVLRLQDLERRVESLSAKGARSSTTAKKRSQP